MSRLFAWVFLGNDPSTDLRGVGLLGLVHLLFLITDARTQSLAKQIYKLSLHVTQVHFLKLKILNAVLLYEFLFFTMLYI